MEDLLIVSFTKNDRNNEAGLCIARKDPNGDTTVLKIALDEQARILYRLLTDQSSKAEIMAESEDEESDIFVQEYRDNDLVLFGTLEAERNGDGKG